MLSKYKDDGLNAAEFVKGQVPITISFTKGKFFNPCTLAATLSDKNSDDRIDIKGEFIIE